MKKLITLLLLFSFLYSHAQEDTSHYQKYPNAYGPQYKDIWATRVMRLPDTTGHRPQLGVPGAIGRNTAGTQIFVWDGTQWVAGAGGVTVDSTFITSIDSIFINTHDSIFIVSGADTIYIGQNNSSVDSLFISNTDSIFQIINGDTIFIGENHSGIDSIFITNTDSIFVIEGNDTVFIGMGNGIRDTAYLTANYGILIDSDDSTYKPNGANRSISVDTSAIHQFIVNVVNSDTTLIINNQSDTAVFIVDTLANAPPTVTDGYKVLIGTSPTGAFAGHANDIAEKVGAAWTFTDASQGDQLIVDNVDTYATYQFNGTTWQQTSILWRVNGNRGLGNNGFLGKVDKKPMYLRAWNKVFMEGDTTRFVYFPKYTYANDSNLYFKPGAGGKLDTGSFRLLVAGPNITISSGPTKDTISSTGGGTPAGNYGNVQLNRNSTFATPASDSLSFNSGTLTNKGSSVIKGTATITTTATGTAGTDSLLVQSNGLVKKISPTYYSTGGGSTDTTNLSRRIDSVVRHLPYYYVTDTLGCADDSVTDCTAAINATVQKAYNRGGGVVYFPYVTKGKYLVSAAINAAVDSAQISLPVTTYAHISEAPTIVLKSDIPPHNYSDWTTGQHEDVKGVWIISSLATKGYVIGSTGTADTWGTWNFTNLFIQNLGIQTRSVTNGGTDTTNTMSALDVSKVSVNNLLNVKIKTQSFPGTSVIPAVNTYGIRGPANNNFNSTNWENVYIQGFATGARLCENVKWVNGYINTCINGVELIGNSGHLTDVNNMLMAWNITNILITGRCEFNFLNLDIEDYKGASFSGSTPNKWFNNVTDINETSTTSSLGNINYYLVWAFGWPTSQDSIKHNITSPGIVLQHIGWQDSLNTTKLRLMQSNTAKGMLGFTPTSLALAKNALYTTAWNRATVTDYASVADFTGYVDSAAFRYYTSAPAANPISNFVKQFEINHFGNGYFRNKVSINGTDTTYNLNVTGSTNTTLNSYTGGFARYKSSSTEVGAVQATSTQDFTYMINSTYDGSNYQRTNVSNYAGLFELTSTSSIGDLQFYTSAPAANPISNFTKRFEVDKSGNGYFSASLKVNATSFVGSEKLNVNGNGFFGTTSVSGSTTPLFVSFGGTYGTGTLGVTGNLKWMLFDDGTAADSYGIGMSSGFMDVHAGSTGGLNFSTNNGTAGLKITSGQIVSMPHYGAGTATFDASGIISSVSDERVKNILGYSHTGLKAIMNLRTIDYKYNGLSGNETNGTYVGFSAQNVKANIPYSTGVTADGYLTLQDRAVMAAMVNAIQEQQKEIEDLRQEIKQLKKK